MNKIMKFENTTIDIQFINGVPMFELYSVGMALGQVKKNTKGVVYPRKDRIEENVRSAEIQACVRNGHKYITESQIYDLMLEARTDKCRAFRKWLTNEVLPQLNHTGTYTMPHQGKQLRLDEKSYEYFDKTYNGEPVLTSMDVNHFADINYSVVDWYARRYLTKGKDYYYLVGDELRNYKQENPKVSRLSSTVVVFTRSGFDKICKAYGIEVETPKPFIEEKKAEDSKREVVVLPSKAMKGLMEYIQRETKAIEGISHLMLTRDTKENLNNYRKLLSKRIKDLRGYCVDIETIKI